ncbi:type II toxin-antitoxin system Phd/YefM family antitoxin [Sulfobacillus acidophilus]|uniref:Antitoxin n=1 Tax=Sulfobacillus acidophilus TaxID=53633 RepID=A0ABS3AVI9_9FIRM|nr:type II toxin-antitoxin system Phd/YefM family antitoxin [Sulfobacillus acidophilus]
MSTLSATKARENFYKLIDKVALEHEPALITGKRHNAVLVGEEDWRGILETLYLMRTPGMANSIKEGLKTPAKDMSEDIDW